ncbi:ImmA/IrrE family metallo-endopeptidase [Lentilactobacillus senioris]|uniref:ImmA/IrrE family metallo-endopeptidase n=1 Tax=Lentilactobacillus senioris TaxID=931534 RepID=UPI003D293A6C
MSLSKLEELERLYEQYVQIIEVKGLKEHTGTFGTFRMKNGKPFIFLERDQPEVDKQVILTEEFMHMLTSVGVIVNQSQLDNRRQERLARSMTYKSMLSLDDILDCYNRNIYEIYEIANELDLPIEFIQNALEYFKTQIGTHGYYKNYEINIGSTITFREHTTA